MTDSRERWGIDRNDALDRIKTDREHGAEEARRARLTTARREVYLELIKEMTAASMALGGMPFQKGEDLDIQGGLQRFISAVARVAILGEMNTVLKSRELMNLLQQILYKKMPEIVEMRLVRTEQMKFEQANKLQLERSEGIKEFIKELIKDRKGGNSERLERTAYRFGRKSERVCGDGYNVPGGARCKGKGTPAFDG